MSPRLQVVSLVVLALLIAGSDFGRRLYVGRNASLHTVTTEVPVALRGGETLAQMQTTMHAWFPVLKDPTEQPNGPPDPQSWQFALVGMFTNRDALSGVIAAWLPGSLTAEYQHVVAGDTVHDWKVSGLSARAATLVYAAETRELGLFKSGQSHPPGAALAVTEGPVVEAAAGKRRHQRGDRPEREQQTPPKRERPARGEGKGKGEGRQRGGGVGKGNLGRDPGAQGAQPRGGRAK